MRKAQPLTPEQKRELEILVDSNVNLVNEVYVELFNEDCQYYDTVKMFHYRGSWSDDLDVLRDNYLYKKLKRE